MFCTVNSHECMDRHEQCLDPFLVVTDTPGLFAQCTAKKSIISDHILSHTKHMVIPWYANPYIFKRTYCISFITCCSWYSRAAILGSWGIGNDSWIRLHVGLQLGLIDGGSSMCSHSVLLLAVETNYRTRTALEIRSSVSIGGNY